MKCVWFFLPLTAVEENKVNNVYDSHDTLTSRVVEMSMNKISIEWKEGKCATLIHCSMSLFVNAEILWFYSNAHWWSEQVGRRDEKIYIVRWSEKDKYLLIPSLTYIHTPHITQSIFTVNIWRVFTIIILIFVKILTQFIFPF